jgi:hypothetical protein
MKSLLLAALLALSFIFTGCADKEAEVRNAFNALPEWYQNPRALGDEYAAAGSAKPNKAGDIELQKVEAMAVARSELARMMDVEVKDMFKRATQELGIGESQSIDHAVQYVTKQVTDVSLKGSYQKRLHLDPDNGMLYVLMVLDQERVDQMLKQSIETSLGNEQALWQKFQATQMWQELDTETAK